MKIRSLLIPFSCLSLAMPAGADTFVLKDGSRLEGRILSETSDSYQLEVLVGKSIKDERKVAKSEVAEIIAVNPDEKDFEKIKGLSAVPDFSTADEYARRMALVSKFIADHPKGSKTADAEALLATLKSEAEVISGGGIKMNGKMVAGEEYQADLYDIDAKILEKRIREAIARGDTISALRGIGRMDLDFRSTNSSAAIMPLKKQLLAAYKAQIEEQLSTYDARVAERAAGMARMSRDARAATEQAHNEEVGEAKARFEADQKNEQMWKTTHPFFRESLEEAENTITEQSAEEEFKQEVDAGRVYRNILKFISANDDKDKIADALNQGEQALIPERYLKILKAAASAKGVE